MYPILLLAFCFTCGVVHAQTWQEAFAAMPLRTGAIQLNRTNCVAIMLRAFRPNTNVKALVFMPGATDEFYLFRRAKADVTKVAPTLLDAVEALTNQTRIQADFCPPLLLLHSDEDNLDPQIRVEHQATADRLAQRNLASEAIYLDRDWDSLQPVLKKQLKADIRPWRHLQDSWHFYRHSFAAGDLTAWEMLRTVALAGKSGFVVRRNQIIFLSDRRVRSAPSFKTDIPKS
jgi:hypothetical protein